MSERSRDPAGRPLSDRPRDDLGRPLPRGATGVARVDESVLRTPDATLDEAQRLLDDGRPFHAHEVLEGAWKHSPEAERELWQGLAQLAVGLTHLLRGNGTGARAVLARGRDHVAGYLPGAPHELDGPGLVRWADALIDGADPTPPRLRTRNG